MPDLAHIDPIPPAELRTRAARLLASGGLDRRDAEVVATSLVDADLRGVHSHGVNRIGIYLTRLCDGGNSTAGRVETVADAPAFALLDAGHLLSQIVSERAVSIVAEKADELGCAAVAVRAGSHFGAAGYWARLLAERGLVGIVTTNTTPLMAAFGGATTAIGTNPIAIAFPSAGPSPVVMDLATSEATWGALVNAAAAGSEIPLEWALDEDGRPTADPDVAVRARRLLPFGRHKGYALAVAIELLSGGLAGAAMLSNVGDMYAETDRPMNAGHLFIAVAPDRIAETPGSFSQAVADAQAEINAMRPVGDGRVLWPGQLEAELSAQREADGIPLPAQIARDLDELERELGVHAGAVDR